MLQKYMTLYAGSLATPKQRSLMKTSLSLDGIKQRGNYLRVHLSNKCTKEVGIELTMVYRHTSKLLQLKLRC